MSGMGIFGANCSKKQTSYGSKGVAYLSPDNLRLINRNGRVVAPRPNRPLKDVGEP